MIETTATYNAFWLIIFTFLAIVVITIGIIFAKTKDNNLFGNIFNRHVDEHVDTTDKFSKAHTEVVALPKVYEDELHVLETDVKKANDRLSSLEQVAKATDSKILNLTIDINNKLDLVIQRIVELEKKK